MQMSASELSADESSSSGSSEITISDFEIEVEQFETLSDGSRTSHDGQSSRVEGRKASDLSLPSPYDDEPMADFEWIEKYRERKQNEAIQIKALQDRLEDSIPVNDW